METGIMFYSMMMSRTFQSGWYRGIEENYLDAIESYQDTMCGSQADHLFDKLYAFDAEHGKVMTDDDESDD